MKKTLEITFNKLLGKGRAFLTPKGFTSDIFDLFVSPLVELKDRLISFKFIHFPTALIDKNNIENGEELFEIAEIEGKTLEERAAAVEASWTGFAGSQNYNQLEKILRKKGFAVRVIEHIPQNYNLIGKRLVGNGVVHTKDGKLDPIVIKNGKHTFIVQADEFMSKEQYESLIETLVKVKPAQNGAYIIPRFLRKKEIHHRMTKREMQTYKKNQYCDCRPLELDKIYI